MKIISTNINDVLVYPGEGHTWFVGGNSNSKFIQALNFTSNFLYPLLPCNNTTFINEFSYEKKLVKIVDLLGKEVQESFNTPLFYIYEDRQVEKKIILR